MGMMLFWILALSVMMIGFWLGGFFLTVYMLSRKDGKPVITGAKNDAELFFLWPIVLVIAPVEYAKKIAQIGAEHGKAQKEE